jgi:hypothetical protein
VNQQRYFAYRSLIAELYVWRSVGTLADDTHDELRDAAEGLLLSRDGDAAEDSLARASATVLGLLALDDLGERDASWLLDALLACGPRLAPAGELVA